jgi:hypothetical protein
MRELAQFRGLRLRARENVPYLHTAYQKCICQQPAMAYRVGRQSLGVEQDPFDPRTRIQGARRLDVEVELPLV